MSDANRGRASSWRRAATHLQSGYRSWDRRVGFMVMIRVHDRVQ